MRTQVALGQPFDAAEAAGRDRASSPCDAVVDRLGLTIGTAAADHEVVGVADDLVQIQRDDVQRLAVCGIPQRPPVRCPPDSQWGVCRGPAYRSCSRCSPRRRRAPDSGSAPRADPDDGSSSRTPRSCGIAKKRARSPPSAYSSAFLHARAGRAAPFGDRQRWPARAPARAPAIAADPAAMSPPRISTSSVSDAV